MILNQGVSLRVKILLILTMLPLVMLGTYLFIVLNVFKSDKLAYVYETTSSTTQNIANQVSTSINSILSIVRPMVDDFYANDGFAAVSKAIMDVENPISWVAVFVPRGGEQNMFDRIGVVEREKNVAAKDLAQIKTLGLGLAEVFKSELVVQIPFADERLLIYEKVGKKVFVIMGNVPAMHRLFHGQGAIKSFLVNNAGGILLGLSGKGDEVSTFVENVGRDYFFRLRQQKATSGTERMSDGKNDFYLASFAKIGIAGLSIVSFIPQAEALSAIKTIVIRSILFALLLISLSIFISLIASGRLTAAISDLFEATKKIADGNFNIRVSVNANDEVGALAASFNSMAEQISVLMSETAEKSRMENELKTAKTVQETLFPDSEAQLGVIKVVGYYEPASECGGDWWHYSETKDRIYFWIGDATGHGASAALLTSAAKSAATLIESLNVDPEQAMYLMNQSIYEVSKGKIMMTFFIGCFDKYTKVLKYVNASHEPPLLVRKATSAPSKDDLVPLQDSIGPRLGQERGTVYKQAQIDLNLGDRIIFYTDGLYDIRNPDKKQMGERKFIRTFLQFNQNYAPIGQIMSNLIKETRDYRQATPLDDDVTFFMCEYVNQKI